MIKDMYERVTATALAQASTITPPVLGLTASIDEIYAIDQRRMSALVSNSLEPTGDRGSSLAHQILDRIRHGRGGELAVNWDGGPHWLATVLGDPDARQIGGNAAQASWALASVGAPSVLALADRSSNQLAVLDPRMVVAVPSGLSSVADLDAQGSPSKWPHGILEFTAGTLLRGTPIPRTTRVMLRFSHEPLETDEEFARYVRLHRPRVALLSGLATQPDMATPDLRWATRLASDLARDGATVHHELSDFGTPARMRSAIRELPATSLGMSLSELTIASGSRRDPVEGATRLAEGTGVDRVVVHADDWSLMVTRSPTQHQHDALVLANALAGARARLGHPAEPRALTHDGVFTGDHPPGGPIRDGWHALVVPAPYQPHPVGTVGLGDTFVAGLLLGDSLRPKTERTRERQQP